MSTISRSKEHLLGALAYVGGPFTGVPMLLLFRSDSYIQFHAMQSSIVFGTILLFYLTLGILPAIGWLTTLLMFPVVVFVWMALAVFLMWKAFGGEKYRLPYFGDVADRQLAKLS